MPHTPHLARLCAIAATAAFAFALDAAAQIQPAQPQQRQQSQGALGSWRTPDGRTADADQSAACRDQVRQGALTYKPADDEQRYEREAQLFDRCMRSRGFTR